MRLLSTVTLLFSVNLVLIVIILSLQLNSSLAENEDYYPFKASEEIIFKLLCTPSCLKEKRILREEAIAQQVIFKRLLVTAES